MRFAGRSVIITGATGGLGRATSTRFHNEGANVALVDLSKNELNTFSQSLDSGSGNVITIEADVSKDADVKNYIDKTMEAFGHVDTLFNNAGIEGNISSTS